MTNSMIQEKLSFFALAGTRDVLHENKMVIKRRRRRSTPIVTDDLEANRGLKVIKSIQLSLF